EAMACGLPVVGVAAGGVGETVDETFGQLADRPTSQAMAEAIEALFRRDVHALGQQARRRAVERYAWDAVFERLTGL
ncbi:glycosyltransferase, partial [Escherichia coli]|uniref:glycosyltransferase n=3 Tax=Pseudomonadota TaxID=1224 RepID=UPI0028E00833